MSEGKSAGYEKRQQEQEPRLVLKSEYRSWLFIL